MKRGRRHALRALAGVAAGPALAQVASDPRPRTLQVGPARRIARLADAARDARSGDVIEVDAGDYHADVAAWEQADLQLRAVGGRVRLWAGGAAAEGKAIWVVRATRLQAEGFDFIGCRVPHRNGAGIRLEAGSLALRDCRFLDNEMGLMTANDAGIVLRAEGCEFAHNRRPDGHNHQLYAGAIAQLELLGCWLHGGDTGHLLKSRAAHSRVIACRLDDADGQASYEAEFPDGGDALLLACLLRQGRATRNEALASYGAEGRRWPRNRLRIAHCTWIDDTGSGTLLRVAGAPPQTLLANNVWLGSDRIAAAGAELRNNFTLADGELALDDGHHGWLREGAAAAGRAEVLPPELRPRWSYRHPAAAEALQLPPRHPGAFQRLAPRRP